MTGNTAAQALIDLRKIQRNGAQQRLEMWMRLKAEVRGSIHAFATDRDAEHIENEIKIETESILALNRKIKELEDPPAEPEVQGIRFRFMIQYEEATYCSPFFSAISHLVDWVDDPWFARFLHAKVPMNLQISVRGGQFETVGYLHG